jgi:hypothetical protein
MFHLWPSSLTPDYFGRERNYVLFSSVQAWRLIATVSVLVSFIHSALHTVATLQNCYTWEPVCIPGPTPSAIAAQLTRLRDYCRRSAFYTSSCFIRCPSIGEWFDVLYLVSTMTTNGSTDISGVLALRVVRYNSD